MNERDILQRWNAVAKTPRRRYAISPTDETGEYELSGETDAMKVSLLVDGRDLDILDYGCGDGRVSIPLSADFRHVVAYDPAVAMIKALREKDPPDNLIGVTTLEGVQVDVAVAITVFIHHTWHGAGRMLREVSDALRPGGRAFLQIPLYDEPREGATWIDVSVWTPPMLLAAAGAAGLEVVEYKASPGPFTYPDIGEYHDHLHELRKP